MSIHRRRLLVLAVLTSMPCFADEPPKACDMARWTGPVTEAAARFEIPAAWIRAVIRAESAGCERLNREPTTSVAGAMGLMQLMPQTWREYRDKLALGDNAYDPRENILAGAAYLRDLYDRYGWPGAAAAYHAGPQRYEDSLTHAKPLPEATEKYLAQIDYAMTSAPSKRADSAAPKAAKSNAIFVQLRGRKVEPESQKSESADVQDR
jgi:soluble lytic murein transglycosylase-like protein